MLRVSTGLFPWDESTQAKQRTHSRHSRGGAAGVTISHPLYRVTGEQRELESLIPYRVCVLVPLALPCSGGGVRQGFVWPAGAIV